MNESREGAKAAKKSDVEELSAIVVDAESREGAKSAKKLDVEELSAVVVDAELNIHKDLGPGLLESVYEAVLARAGVEVESA